MTRITLDIDSAPFVRSHARNPSGRGSWAFSLQANPRDVCKDVVFAPSMTYSDAKVWVKAWFREQYAAGAFPLLHGASFVTLYAQP